MYAEDLLRSVFKDKRILSCLDESLLVVKQETWIFGIEKLKKAANPKSTKETEKQFLKDNSVLCQWLAPFDAKSHMYLSHFLNICCCITSWSPNHCPSAGAHHLPLPPGITACSLGSLPSPSLPFP